MDNIFLRYQTHINRRGVTMIEYGILAALIAIVAISTLNMLGSNTNNMYCTLQRGMTGKLSMSSIASCAIKETYGQGTSLKWTSAGGASCGSTCLSPTITSWDSNILYAINQASPITSFYGISNADGTPATTLAEAIKINNNLNAAAGDGIGTKGITTPDGSIYEDEVRTSDGNTYGIFYNLANGSSMGYRNLETGETYTMNQTTGKMTDQGVTSGNLWGNNNI